LQKLVLLITPEDKTNKQQNQAIILFIGDQAKTFPQICSFAVNRFEMIKNTFRASCE